MTRIRLLVAVVFLSIEPGAILAAQDDALPDPQIKQFAAVTTLLQQGKPAEAEHILDHVQLRSNQSKFKLGNSTLSTYAVSSTLLISTYMGLNDYADAERVAKDRVVWSEQQYGPKALQVAGFLSLLAEIERLQTNYKAAEPLYVRSLSIHRSLNLADCLVAKSVYSGLAETYLALNRPREAEELLSPAIDACREKFGDKGMGRADLFDAYAVALENDNKTAEAAKAASEADRVSMLVPRVEEENRDLLRGRLLAAQGRFDESLAPCHKWIGILEVPNGPESDRRLMLPLGECQRLLQLAGRGTEAAEVGARLKGIKAKYGVRF